MTPTPPSILLNCAPGRRWDQNRPETITDALFAEPLQAVGARGGAKTVRLGLTFAISYLNGPPDQIAESVRRLLALSEKWDAPVVLALDGQNWWGYRPDLWNWWDKAAPGYHPQNRDNVEWTDWSAENAVKICWRNWGRQIRVLPAPHIASPRVREACRPLLTQLARQIKKWADGLPREKVYLFPGVKVGWEASIGINAFHYPGGNRYLEEFPSDLSRDPQTGLKMQTDFAGGLAPLGYAALTAKGWTHKGPITLDDHNRLVADYLNFLARTAREAGLSREQVFTHAGGQFAPWEKHISHRVAVNKHSLPGWSLYNVAPENAGDLAETVTKNKMAWCAAEWLPSAKTAGEWAEAYRACLRFGDCRFVAVYNWESIAAKPEAIAGLRNVLSGGYGSGSKIP